MLNTIEIYENFTPIAKDIRGWNSNDEIFKELINKKNPKMVVEVGSWKGESAIQMAEHIKALNIDSKIICVDTWLGAEEFWTTLSNTEDRNLMFKNGYPQIYYQFLSNVVHTNNQHIITPLPLPSSIAYKVLQYHNIKADLIYIDGSHEYQDVLTDIRNYLPILNDGGILFGDDYTNTWPGVVRAVNDELGNKINVVNNNFWVYEKS